MKRINETNKGASTILAFALIPLSGFALDVYIPSLPDMAAKLHATPAAIQLTLSVFLISYGVCQLFIGSLLDSYGRYWPSIVGLFCFSAASFVIAGSVNLNIIYLMRAVQGISVATIVVSKRSLFIDMYSGDKLKHYTSLFSVIWSAAPIIAPFLGGYLQTRLGWQSNFYFLGYLGLVFLLLELIISGESIQQKHPFNLKVIAGAYRSMLSTKDFTLGMTVLALVYSMLLVYGMASPFLIERLMHYPATVTGNASLTSGLAVLAGGVLSKRLITKPFVKKILIASVVQVIAVMALILLTFRVANIYTLLAYVIILHSASGFIFNTVLSYLLTSFTNYGGKASGLAGGGYIIFTSAFSYLVVSSLSIKSQVLLGSSYFLLAIVVLVIIATTHWRGEPSIIKRSAVKVPEGQLS